MKENSSAYRDKNGNGGRDKDKTNSRFKYFRLSNKPDGSVLNTLQYNFKITQIE